MFAWWPNYDVEQWGEWLCAADAIARELKYDVATNDIEWRLWYAFLAEQLADEGL